MDMVITDHGDTDGALDMEYMDHIYIDLLDLVLPTIRFSAHHSTTHITRIDTIETDSITDFIIDATQPVIEVIGITPPEEPVLLEEAITPQAPEELPAIETTVIITITEVLPEEVIIREGIILQEPEVFAEVLLEETIIPEAINLQESEVHVVLHQEEAIHLLDHLPEVTLIDLHLLQEEVTLLEAAVLQEVVEDHQEVLQEEAEEEDK